MAGSKIPLTFRIYKGEQFLREETLAQPVIKVGKLSSSHLRLDDDSVSRMHAVIEVSGPGSISIIDLGSTKGTQVNGQKVNKANLQDGDLVVLGDIRIELSVGDATASDEDAVTRVNLPATPSAPPAPAPAPIARAARAADARGAAVVAAPDAGPGRAAAARARAARRPRRLARLPRLPRPRRPPSASTRPMTWAARAPSRSPRCWRTRSSR